MADGIKFLPSFASSPAGKLAMGQSPASGMVMGMSVSPPVQRRSPTARFTPGTGMGDRWVAYISFFSPGPAETGESCYHGCGSKSQGYDGECIG